MSEFTSNGSSHGEPASIERIRKIFRNLGINEYEPQLTLQIADLVHLLTKQVITEAKSVSEYSSKKHIDRSDIEFALRAFG